MGTQINFEDVKIKEYINKYVKELQRHFDIEDKRMQILLKEVYQEFKPKTIFDDLISMVKSFYSLKIKGNNNGN